MSNSFLEVNAILSQSLQEAKEGSDQLALADAFMDLAHFKVFVACNHPESGVEQVPLFDLAFMELISDFETFLYSLPPNLSRGELLLEASELVTKAQEVYVTLGETERMADAFLDLGEMLLTDTHEKEILPNQVSLAERYLKEALEIHRLQANTEQMALGLRILARYYMDLKELDKAEEYWVLAIETDADPSSRINNFSEMVLDFQENGDFERGEKYLIERIALSEKDGDPRELPFCYLEASEFYEAKGELEKSQMYSEKTRQLILPVCPDGTIDSYLDYLCQDEVHDCGGCDEDHDHQH